MANILLAEDDESMLNFLVLALERGGHVVTPTQDGLEALNKLKAANDGFDLLLTDIVMPGLDGIELAQQATELSPKIKVMFITGFAAMAIRNEDDKTDKSTQVISKPFHLNDLVKQIETLLAS